MKYVIDISIGIELNLQIALGSVDILMMLILPIPGHSMCLHLFVSSLIFFSSVLHSFVIKGLLPPWLGLFLRIYFSFCYGKWDFFPDFCF